jgi:hypothetical protein
MSDKLSLSMQLGVPTVPEYVRDDPQLFSELQRILNGINNLAAVVDAYTGRAPLTSAAKSGFTIGASTRSQYLDVLYAVAQENLPAGSAVYLRYDSGEKLHKVWKATATDPTKFCQGFVVTDGGVASGSYCAVQLSVGLVPFIGGLTEGITYYLSDTAGSIGNLPGTNLQKVGYALGPTYFYFIPNPL